jgi:hypothetical protein
MNGKVRADVMEQEGQNEGWGKKRKERGKKWVLEF